MCKNRHHRNAGNGFDVSDATPVDSTATRSKLELHLPIATSVWPMLSGAAFHGPAGDFVRAIDPHTEADPMALLIQTLTVFGSAVGRGPHFRVEGDKHHTNLFAILVGRTAKGRKGSSWGRVLEILSAADSAWADGRVVSGLSSGEGLIWAVRDPLYNGEDELIDPGVSDKRLMVVESEFATTLRVLRRETNTLSPIIRSGWDTGKLRTLTKNSPAVATDAHISIIGHITRDELLRHLDGNEMANGFANRFLWVCVKRSKCLPEGGKLDESTLFSFSSLIRKALNVAKEIGEMHRSEGARALWRDVYGELSDDNRPGLFGAVTSRAEAQVTRLSFIYALLDGSPVIEIQHLQAALAAWKYCEDSCRYIFGDSLGHRLADRIHEAIRTERAGLTRSDISALLGHNVSAQAIAGALGVLVEHRLISCETITTKGRPIERWHAVTKETKKAAANGVGEVRP